ncbi:DUF5329 domain-containing protein [Massilia consociata]|uniref:DUF5329 domain-containing protein n=1 Tax=Massilia consociata TaxID=760117 RepID=A0ABV6FHY5_9BURK
MPFIRRSRLAALALLGAACLSANAAPTPATVRAEIEALLGRITASGCQFERNRSWHSGDDARAHLLRKLKHIEGRPETVTSTEQFIEFAASKSSFSGRPYRVRCGNGDPVESRAWLHRELKALRAADTRAKQ